MTSARAPRTLVIDENLPKRLATELRYRGRDSVAVTQLGLRGSSDPELLPQLDGQLDDWVLITADDQLPLVHADAVRTAGATIAVVNPIREASWSLDPWRREIVHRWAHSMHEQTPATVRRYSLHRHALWHPRRGSSRA